jgi:hypothetical protein
LTAPNCNLAVATPMAEHIKDELDPSGDSQLFEDPVNVVPDGVLLHFEPVSDFAVLQAIGDEENHVSLAASQQRCAMGVDDGNCFEINADY